MDIARKIDEALNEGSANTSSEIIKIIRDNIFNYAKQSQNFPHFLRKASDYNDRKSEIDKLIKSIEKSNNELNSTGKMAFELQV